MFKSLTPNLGVDNVSTALDFYETVLGFQRVMVLPEQAPFDWGMVKLGDIQIMFQERANLGDELSIFKDRAPGGVLTFYLEVEDIEALHQKIHPQVSVLKAPHDTFYGMREFTIKDPNGYVLTFGQPIPGFAPDEPG
ncbi:bleomycin resistance protein [Gloeobacter kilaueensis]|uniref:Bleomycin resistance protein n=1 Tax=Gloeobacter kilaueensis (strain ATCC BAA-2537 / CCAP 1431/1 / ULC 316 / JS1) TaxID=1183438 RepID=U5QCR6_GLOK1|nr:VOC family protein [Gloeobacter kilaueensis]AGY56671.1 glyoxalase/bleomycin resistance protein/dioxygenase [Gloeobacter kilaueensis JS1]